MKSNLTKSKLNAKRDLLVVILTVLALVIFLTNKVYATGGKNKTCSDAQITSVENGNQNEMSYTVSGGQIESVCIKSGVNMFDAGHSGSLGNGDYEDGCYTVSGVGTSTVTVKRNKDGKTCQGISHLDIYTSDGEEDENSDCEDEEQNEENDEEGEKGGNPENEDNSDNSNSNDSSDNSDENNEESVEGVLGLDTQVLAATGSAEMVISIAIMLVSGFYLKSLLKKKALC
jgi:hypothetical protein